MRYTNRRLPFTLHPTHPDRLLRDFQFLNIIEYHKYGNILSRQKYKLMEYTHRFSHSDNTKSKFMDHIFVLTVNLELRSIESVIKWRIKYVHLKQVL